MLKIIFLVLFSCTFAKQQPKIVIVGSGLSGLSAAVDLSRNGFENILILEAENRIGGRIYSVKINEKSFVDLGAQWVHGEGNNSVFELAKDKYKFGVTGFDDHYPYFIQSDGKSLNQNQCQNYADTAMKILFSSYDEMSKFSGSIKEFFVKKYRKEVEKVDGNEALVNEFIDFYEKEMNIWNGSSTWSDLSAKLHTISGYNSGTQHLTWKRDGFKKIFDFLLEGSDILGKIYFNKEVANVQWNPRYEKKLAIITTTDGYKYFADHVIFTPSLGVLKAHYRTLFSPQLPKQLRTAINVMGYGNIGKIFLEFEKPFWPTSSDWVGYGLLWTKGDVAAIKGTDKEWLLDIQMFAKVDGYSNLLEGLLAGPNMKTFETLNDKKLISDSMWLFEKFLKKSLPQPTKMRRTKWLTSKNFLGSYSYHSMSAYEFNVTSKDLAQTLYNQAMKPEVVFAGEHTDELYSSNAHGAINSGRRAANEIIQYYSNIIII